MHTHSEVVSMVNEVVETLNERESGYEKAAEHVKDPMLSKMFSDFVSQSQQFISELMPFSEETSPKDIGKGPLGTLYQGWMNLKEKISGYQTSSIINDCIAGEEAAVKVYQGVLNDEEIPADLRFILEGQFGNIRASQEKLRLFQNK